MRTVTDAQAAVYSVDNSTGGAYAKVEVYDTQLSTWIDLTNYLGYNWVRSVELQESLESNIQTANIVLATFAGAQAEITASPFVISGLFNVSTGGDPYAALLYPYKQIRVSLAVTPLDTTPQSSDYILKFRGRIAEVEVDDRNIQLTCRDEMGDLADFFVTEEKSYGDDAGFLPAETVIQTILNDWGNSVSLWTPNGTSGTKIAVADLSGWAPSRTPLLRSTVMDAIRKYADQIGYDLRYRWQVNAADIVLVLSAPERTSPTVAYTFTTARLLKYRASLATKNIRNDIRVGFYNLGKQRLFAFSEDAISIGAYGRRFMEVGEEETSHINTLAEAQALATAIKNDLALPTMQVQFTVPLFPNAELQDYFTITGDEIITSTQSLGVTAINHYIDNQGGRTIITAEGKPASRRNWKTAQSTWTYKLIGSSNMKTATAGTGNLMHNGDLGQWSGW